MRHDDVILTLQYCMALFHSQMRRHAISTTYINLQEDSVTIDLVNMIGLIAGYVVIYTS